MRNPPTTKSTLLASTGLCGALTLTATAAEILAVSDDGATLFYTDSERGVLGKVDIADPQAPVAAGRVTLDGEPTSVVARGGTVFVAVNTSEDFANPSGHLAVVDPATDEVKARCDVGGHPGSVAMSPNGAFIAVAIKNERDEDEDDGTIPQPPPGHLAVFEVMEGAIANCDAVRKVDLTGLAEVAFDDPEPEYVAVNAASVAAVPLQENNHVVLVDLASGEVRGHFAAGTVDLEGIAAKEDGVVRMTDALQALPREPDAIAWIDDRLLVTADEGDYEGGSRGFTVFDTEGNVVHASGSILEHLAARLGNYPESRSDSKGTESEGVVVGCFGEQAYLFVDLERANAVVVYALDGQGTPRLVQTLPTGVGPEGILTIPSRGLLAAAAEADEPEEGVRATIALYGLQDTDPAYP